MKKEETILRPAHGKSPMIQVAPAVKTILVIDDNEQDRRQWRDGLHQLSPNFLFLEAADGQSGLDICRRRQVDCVILDPTFQTSRALKCCLASTWTATIRALPSSS
jgi:PleD family two-component response regulator